MTVQSVNQTLHTYNSQPNKVAKGGLNGGF